jgi:hypothetical protein
LNAIVGFINVLNLKIHSGVSIDRTKLHHIRAVVAFSNRKTMDANFLFAAAQRNQKNTKG